MKKVITKTQVIEALEKEPVLIRGAWFGDIEQPNCPVCAVGAVLRKVSFEKWCRKISGNLGRLGEKAGGIVHGKSEYLGSLSVYFEEGHSRKQCIAFVKKHFPSKFKLEIKAGDVRWWVREEERI